MISFVMEDLLVETLGGVNVRGDVVPNVTIERQ